MSKKKKPEQSRQKRQRKGLKAVKILPAQFNERQTPAKYEYEQLGNISTEFLDCFVILGFNPEGYGVQIINSRNPKETHSLVHLLKTFLQQIEADDHNAPPEED